MNLKKVISHDTVRAGLLGTTKEEIIEEMADLLVKGNAVLDKSEVLRVVMEREEQMSTGINNGIAIPHGKTDNAPELCAALGVSSQPVDFQSIDKQPSSIFVMTVSPPSAAADHLQFLAALSRIFNTEDARNRILSAKTDAELLKAFLREASS